MNWKIGQKLVCVADTSLIRLVLSLSMPTKDDVVTYDGEVGSNDAIYLKEYNYKDQRFTNDGHRFNMARSCFKPLVGTTAKSELINSFKEVTETSDCPIKQPEPQTT